MRDDGAAQLCAALARVAVFEAGLVVGELDAPPHRFGGVFAFVESGEIAEVAFAVRAGAVGGEAGGAVDFQHVAQVAASGVAAVCEMAFAAGEVVGARLIAGPGCEAR